MEQPRRVATVTLPTVYGEFQAHAFECGTGFVYLALVQGDVRSEGPVLTRVHSECLTGDALASLRCDCGVQLHVGLREIAAEGRGVLLYATGHEGRGIGLVNKLRAYVAQDAGADTLDANLHIGMPVDARDYTDAAAVLKQLGIRSARLMTNNPGKVAGLQAAGLHVDHVAPIPTAAHARNRKYLETKQARLGHFSPAGHEVAAPAEPVADVGTLLGEVRPHEDRPHVVLKYAQTLDGRIATGDGDAKWISGDGERAVSHALRAACDGVLVGVGTVLTDNPRLTVRMVPGPSPLRIVLDSSLRTPPEACLLEDDATTLVLTTDRSSAQCRDALRARQVGVHVVPEGPDGIDLAAALKTLHQRGVRSLLIEGGARVITSALAAGLVDRVIVGIAPTIIGAGTDAVGDLGVARIADGIKLVNRSLHSIGDDVILAWDVAAR